MLTMKTMLTIETYCVIMLTLSSYRAAERGAMAGKHAIRATQKSGAGYCQERAGRTTARVPALTRLCWRMKEILECALIQGDRKGSPLLYTAWGAALFVYSRGGASPALLHCTFCIFRQQSLTMMAIPVSGLSDFCEAL